MIVQDGISYYDIVDVCFKLKISEKTLNNWRKTNNIPKPIQIGRKNYYTEEDISKIKEYRHNIHHRGKLNVK